MPFRFSSDQGYELSQENVRRIANDGGSSRRESPSPAENSRVSIAPGGVSIHSCLIQRFRNEDGGVTPICNTSGNNCYHSAYRVVTNRPIAAHDGLPRRHIACTY